MGNTQGANAVNLGLSPALQVRDAFMAFALPPTQLSVHTGCKTAQNAALEDSFSNDREQQTTRASAMLLADCTTRRKTKGARGPDVLLNTC